MVWDESYALGVEEIDRQHKGLFTAVNRVVSVMEAEDTARNRRVCAEAVKYLHNYTVNHFADEEAYMARVGYPGLPGHKKQHESFLETVLFLEKDLTESDYSLPAARRLEGALMSWLLYHVMNTDQAIVGKTKRLSGSTMDDALSAVLVEAMQQIFHEPAEVAEGRYAGGFSGGELFSILDTPSYRFLLAMEEVPLLRRVGALAGRSIEGGDEMAAAALKQLAGDITRRVLAMLEKQSETVSKNRFLRYAEAMSYIRSDAPKCSLLLHVGMGALVAQVWEN